MPLNSRIAAIAALSAALFASGCSTVGYYGQAIRGQLDLMSSREDIDALVTDPATDPELRQRLELVRAAQAYAVSDLALPDNGSYASYVDLGRPYAVANVVATPELSLAPATWCFPVVGCVAYRGYFDEAEATEFAAGLAAEGYDVQVSRSSAYSTLGWFEDPVPSTILFGSTADLVGTIFHEMAHQRVYVQDDSAFNESYAVAVEQAGMRRWLSANGTPEDRERYEQGLQRQADFLDLVLGARSDLDLLYRSGVSDGDKRTGKARVFAEMQADYVRLKASWGGYAGYDGWFNRDLNNAHLALLGTYADYVPAFAAMLREAGGDFAVFHAAVAALAVLPKAERDAVLAGR